MGGVPTVQRLGRYRLLRTIGRGGMATVYHAVQEGPHGFENEVAIKLVHAELLAAFPHVLEMLVDEARIAARIRHPNVVRILDLVEETDRFYMVMDYVDGLSMRQVLDAARERGGRIPPAPVIEVVAAACRGLHAAHSLRMPDGAPSGLVHRDVKPGNILVSASGEVKVGDFGIALFSDRLTESTAHGQLKGTPAYMSPEQVMGEPLDARSDVFSMGLTLFTLVTKKLAFTGENPMKIAVKIASNSLSPHADEMEACVPGLGAIFARACQKEPALRYQNAQEMARALQDLHGTLPSPTPIGEMLAAAGWRPTGGQGEHLSPDWPEPDDDEEETDPELGRGSGPARLGPSTRPRGDGGEDTTPPEAPRPLADPRFEDESLFLEEETPAPGIPSASAGSAIDEEATPTPASGGDIEEPTVVEGGPATPRVEVLLPGEAGGWSPPPPPGAQGRSGSWQPQGAAPPGQRPAPRPGPAPGGGPPPRPPGTPPPGPRPFAAAAPQGSPPGPQPVQPPPPKATATSGWRQVPGGGPASQPAPMPPTDPAAQQGGRARARVQPVRDYRGRVVRGATPAPEATRIGRAEKIGVAVAFVLLLATVIGIVLAQMRSEPTGDPRLSVADAEAPSAEAGTSPVVLPPTVEAKPERTPLPLASTPEAATPTATVSPSPAPSTSPTSPRAATPATTAARAAVPERTPLPSRSPPAERTPSPERERDPARTPSPAGTQARASPTPAPEPSTPRPTATGLLTVNSYPYSQVFIDGRAEGRTPLVSRPFPAGEHEVRLVFPTLGNQEVVQSVTIVAGQEARVTERMAEVGP